MGARLLRGREWQKVEGRPDAPVRKSALLERPGRPARAPARGAGSALGFRGRALAPLAAGPARLGTPRLRIAARGGELTHRREGRMPPWLRGVRLRKGPPDRVGSEPSTNGFERVAMLHAFAFDADTSALNGLGARRTARKRDGRIEYRSRHDPCGRSSPASRGDDTRARAERQPLDRGDRRALRVAPRDPHPRCASIPAHVPPSGLGQVPLGSLGTAHPTGNRSGRPLLLRGRLSHRAAAGWSPRRRPATRAGVAAAIGAVVNALVRAHTPGTSRSSSSRSP